jgi:hypothetical protein
MNMKLGGLSWLFCFISAYLKVEQDWKDTKLHIKHTSIFLFRATKTFEIREEFLGRTNRLLSLLGQGPHRKRYIQQIFYSYVCIHCNGNVFDEPLRSKDRSDIHPGRLAGGIYEVRRSDGLRGNDIRTNLQKDRLRRSEFGNGDSQTLRQHEDLINFPSLLQTKESRLTISFIYCIYNITCSYRCHVLCTEFHVARM